MPGPQRPAKARQSFSFKSPLAVAGGVLLVFVLLLVAANVAPAASLAYVGAYGLLALGLGVAVLVSAFRTSLVQGLLTFFVPFYALYYVFGVSRNKMLMLLTPLCAVLSFGIFLLPGGITEVEISSDSTGTQTTAVGETPSATALPAGLSEQEVRRRDLAGYSVAVAPRANTSSYNKFSVGRSFSVTKPGGRKITLRGNGPMKVERWSVGDQEVMVVNNELIVNYRNYGPLNPGAEVLVNRGAVFIDGKPAAERPGSIQINVSP